MSQRHIFPALEAINAAGVTVEVTASGNLILKPTSAVTPDLVAIVRDYKPELLEWFGDKPARADAPIFVPGHFEGDLAWPDAPIFALEFCHLIAASASVSQLQEDGRGYLLEDHTVKLSEWVADQVKAPNGSGLLERAVRLEVAADVCLPGDEVRIVDLDDDTRELIEASAVESDPPSLTFERLLELRPTLRWIGWNLENYVAAYGGKPRFCANRWYVEDRHRINETLDRAVGTHSLDDGVSATYPWLKTNEANLWVFYRLFNRLPNCRGCACA